jgi:pyruvate formate lyase activating enzyme
MENFNATKEAPTPLQVMVLDIQRMSTEDGPGLRTTVFFKGCNLQCRWCHNPESIPFVPTANWYKLRCIGCNICQTACKQQGISRNEAGIRFARELCVGCYTCEHECPSGAIELKGKRWDVEKLAVELLKDKSYCGEAGGITLSGGEVMMQANAAAELARLLKNKNVGTALDTAGNYKWELFEKILPYIDIVLYDIKLFDSDLHKQFTGATNEVILDNYKKLIKNNVRVWVRTPIIEGATDTEENINAIGEFLKEYGAPVKWELCAFNNLCRDKYERLDIEWFYKNTGNTKKEHIEKLAGIASRIIPSAVYTGTVV